MIFIDNKYTKCYYAIVNRAKARINTSGYFEKHHIIPESFYKNRSRKGPAGWVEGNPNEASNIVHLTAKEHWICHLLLCKMTQGAAATKMNNAAWRLATAYIRGNKIRLSSRTYQQVRIKHAKEAQKRNKESLTNPFKQSAVQQRIQKQRIANGTHHMLGGTIQRKTQEKLLKNGQHNFTKSQFISSSKIRMSCVRCKKETGVSGFSQHYDSCLLKASP
jgi:hypothetical protein